MSAPEAAVEAAARAAFERWHPERSWEASPALQEIFKRDAILHLEAAAPHMQAEWEVARKGSTLGPARAITWPDGTVLPAHLQGQDNATGVRAMLARFKKGTTK